MKKLIIALVCLCAPFAARAQLVNVSGNVKDAGAVNTTGSNTFVRFSLINYGPTIPKVIGTNVIANPIKDFHPNNLGNISGTLQGNDTITPDGTDYQVCIFYQGNQFRCATYLIIGPTFNLNTAIPISSPPPSNQHIFGTKTYVFIQNTPSLSWVIPHHFGDKNVQVQCRDLTDHVLFPDTIVLTDQNTVTVNFIIPQAGTCIVISGGNTVFTTIIGDAVVKNPNANQNIVGFILSHDGNPIPDTGTANTWTATQTFQDVNVLGALNIASLVATTGTFSGQITSSLATGTAPFVVASTTKVANLNVDSLDGCDWAAPCGIGSGTPNTGAFTTLAISGITTLTSANPQIIFVGTEGSASTFEIQESAGLLNFHNTVFPTVGPAMAINQDVVETKHLVVGSVANLGGPTPQIINHMWTLTGPLDVAFTSIASQTCQEQPITVTGVQGGVPSAVSVSPSSNLGSVNLTWSGRVSGINTVQVRVCNPSAGALTPSSVDWVAFVAN